jgi:protein SCO1/2
MSERAVQTSVDQTTTEMAFAQRVETARDATELLELLREDHRVYAGVAAANVVRMRGWLYLALARHGVPPAALPYLFEELESGHDAYLVAAAAHALRTIPPDPVHAEFLTAALRNADGRDQPVSFERFGETTTPNAPTSVVGEILSALERLGPMAQSKSADLAQLLDADCLLDPESHQRLVELTDALRDQPLAPCCIWPRGPQPINARPSTSLAAARFEDQDGNVLTFSELVVGRPTVVAFFYTRCDNPLKCSLTVAKLAQLQRQLKAAGVGDAVGIVAITYDPEYDHPSRLRAYATGRGFYPTGSCRVVRGVEGFEAVRRHFRLGVNYARTIVNRHKLELFVLDRWGKTAAAFERFQWDTAEIVAAAQRVLNRPASRMGQWLVTVLGCAASIAVPLFPKCPVCWATYFSLFGALGLGTVPYSPWLRPMLVVAVLFNLASVLLRSVASRWMLPSALVILGTITLLSAQTGIELPGQLWAGGLLTFVGSAASISLRRRK